MTKPQKIEGGKKIRRFILRFERVYTKQEAIEILADDLTEALEKATAILEGYTNGEITSSATLDYVGYRINL
jgi:tetrahydromethanopterin S-methyltransferase subunit B